MRENNNQESIDKNEHDPINKIHTGKSRLNSRTGSTAVILLISVVVITAAAITVGHLIPNNNSKNQQTETLLENERKIEGSSPFMGPEALARAYEAPKSAENSPAESTTAATTIAETTTAASTTSEPTTVPTTAAPTTAKPTTAKPTTAKPTTTAPTTVTPTTVAPTTAPTSTAAPTTTAAPVRQVHDQDTQALLNAVNIHRQSKGFAPLSLASGAAAEAGAIRAQESSIKFDHVRPDGSSPFDLLNQLGVSYRAAGENLAMMPASYSAEQVLQEWLNSDGHRENIESTMFSSMAIGIYEINGYKYWVQLFLG